jgi:hypothetical protein
MQLSQPLAKISAMFTDRALATEARPARGEAL